VSLPQPDPSTVRSAQRGDEHAFAELVRDYELPVYNYVARMVGDRALAEDLTQEIFLRVHNGIAGFSLRCRFTTWVFQIAKNRVLDELRARDRRPDTDALEGVVGGLEVVDAPPEQVELVDALWKAVAGLNPDLKMALLLRDVVGLSYTEIADSLEITLATVKWRIYKAREEVQRALELDGMTEDVSVVREAERP
jgi:RNA polymerase sigma-70 factor (ECF subfamily)